LTPPPVASSLHAFLVPRTRPRSSDLTKSWSFNLLPFFGSLPGGHKPTAPLFAAANLTKAAVKSCPLRPPTPCLVFGRASPGYPDLLHRGHASDLTSPSFPCLVPDLDLGPTHPRPGAIVERTAVAMTSRDQVCSSSFCPPVPLPCWGREPFSARLGRGKGTPVKRSKVPRHRARALAIVSCPLFPCKFVFFLAE